MKDFETFIVVTDSTNFYRVHVFKNKLYKSNYKISKELYPTIDTMIDRIERQYHSTFLTTITSEKCTDYLFAKLI